MTGLELPMFEIRTPDDQSSHMLPQRSCTCQPSVLSISTGGWPCMEEGSNRSRRSKNGIDSGTGSFVTIRLFAV